MIVDVFLPQGDGEDALAEHVGLGVGDQAGVARVGKGHIDAADELEALFDLAKQQHAAIAGDGAAVEVGDDLTFAEAGKDDGGSVTVCHWRPCLRAGSGCLITPETTGSKAAAL